MKNLFLVDAIIFLCAILAFDVLFIILRWRSAKNKEINNEEESDE